MVDNFNHIITYAYELTKIMIHVFDCLTRNGVFVFLCDFIFIFLFFVFAPLIGRLFVHLSVFYFCIFYQRLNVNEN